MATGDPHHAQHTPTQAEPSPAEETRENEEPGVAPGRVGDLRHHGERLHDKASDVGQGTPGRGEKPEGEQSGQPPQA